MEYNIKFSERALNVNHCNELIEYLNNSKFDAPKLDYNNLKRVKVTEHPIVKSLERRYFLLFDRAFVMVYPPGVGSPLHTDINSIEDGENVTHIWKYSGIVFLNDNFNNGELIYPDQGIAIKPKTGNMIIAPADLTYPHLVNAADSERYVLVLRII